MSAAEYEDILATGRFRSVGNCLGGKWFADHLDDARRWALRLTYPAKIFILEVELAEDIATALYANPYLDGIGPGRYAELEDLRDATILTVIDVSKL